MQTSRPYDICKVCTFGFRIIDSQLTKVRDLILGQLNIRNLVLDAKQDRAVFSYLRQQSCSGKMLRPGLLLLSYQATLDKSSKRSVSLKKDAVLSKAIRIAAVVEVIHYATLLHDDVIDGGQKRRGLPTANKLWGNEYAVLLGDFLLSRAFKMCASFEPKIVEVISALTAKICEGELKQVWKRNQRRSLDEAEYLELIAEKTSVFFSDCCFLGGLLNEANKQQLEALSHYGRDFGTAYQINDDLLDIFGSEKMTGKTLGNDIQKNNQTLPFIHLLSKVDEQERNALNRQLSEGSFDKDVLADLMVSYGSLEYAQNRVGELISVAISALRPLEESKAKDVLITTANSLVSNSD
ncbi:MAG: polyprenyl synthetase family protein [Sedimentisphaerales bacterium]|nr:polyprenyl synthetase family protein [Sedimentisphaerales bacterium]